jgi:phosphate transport system substrate-binding protein
MEEKPVRSGHGCSVRGSIVATVLAALLGLTSLSGAVAQEATPAADVAYTPGVDLAQLSGRIIADGSSTVWPITSDAAERFAELAPVIVAVELSGTSGGFRRFCADQSDLQDASREITAEEAAACQDSGVRYEVFSLAYDGITIAVNPKNTWAHCLTVEQLRALWAPDSTVKTWRDLDPAWLAEEIELYGPGPDSGTFDYFTEAIVGAVDDSRTDYIPSENDLDLVEGIASQTNALGYFGYAYYEQNANRLRPLAVDNGAGCVLPSSETIADNSYAPLSRPLYLYVNRDRLARPEIQEFLRFFLSQVGDVVRSVGYVPLPAEDYIANRERLERALTTAAT